MKRWLLTTSFKKKCGLRSGISSRLSSDSVSVGLAELQGKRRIVNWQGNVLANKLLRVR